MSHCKQSSFDNAVHWLLLRWASVVMLWGIGRLSKGISSGDEQNVSLISLTELSRQDSRVVLVCAWLILRFSKCIFILSSCFHHPQGYASMSGDRATRSNAWQADTKSPLCGARARTRGRGLGEETIATPTGTDGRGQSRGSNPLDGTQWVSREPSRGHRPH